MTFLHFSEGRSVPFALFQWLSVSILLVLSGCQDTSETTIKDSSISSDFDWAIPTRFPKPMEPGNNPMSEAKFQLGRHLFYDERLSGNGTQACASCHEQSKGFSDGLTTSVGSTGEVLSRNAQGLLNVAYHATQTWANPSLTNLEQQALIPLFGESPIEHGINDENREIVLQRIKDESRYENLFNSAFPLDGDPIHYENIRNAITSFVRGMVSFDTAFDRYELGDALALNESEQRGRQLFFSEDLECFHCHGGYNLSDSTMDRTMTFIERPFHNTGLFNINDTGAYPDDNQGVFHITENPSDMGKFRAPSLRNIALTAPYMHDGSVETLEEVIEIYAAGGRNIDSGPHAGDGRYNPFKSGFVNGFDISEEEKQSLIAFLNSLTDHSFINNERFSNPW